MQPNKQRGLGPAFLDQRMRDMAEGLTEAIEREVETLRREGLPIYVSEHGEVVDLQEKERDQPEPGREKQR